MRDLIKTKFRDQIKDSLLDDIIKGKIKPGEKLSLVRYADTFKTSVTPVREAFSQLEQSGILAAIPNVGFCTVKISSDESEEIYGLIGLMESDCLKEGISNSNLEKLITVGKKLNNSNSALKRLALDNEFHNILVNKEKNPVKFSILQSLKARVILFEMQYMADRNANLNSLKNHEAIIKALKANDIKLSIKLLKEHWMSSHKFIIKQTLVS